MSAVSVCGLGLGAATASAPGAVTLALTAAVLGAGVWLYVADSLRRRSVFSLVLVVIAFTFANYNGLIFVFPGGKYLCLFAAVVCLVALRPRGSGLYEVPSLVAACLCAMAVAGSLVGRLLLGNPNTALPATLPLVLVAVPLIIEDRVTDVKLRRWMKMASAGCSVLMVFIGLAYAEPQLVSILVFNHEKAFLLIGAVGFAVVARSVLLTIAAVLSTGYAFSQYPAATYVLIVIAVVLTLVIVTPRYRGPVIPFVLSGVLTVSFLVVAFNVEVLLRSSASYFTAVGKIDNSTTREAIYNQVFADVHNPVFSSWFTNDLSISAVLSGQSRIVPAHSDVLTLYLGGGFVAAVLFVLVFACATYAVSRARTRVPGLRFQIAVVLLMIANAGLFAGLVNPIVVNPTSSVIIFSCLACALIIVRSSDGKRVERTGRTETRRLLHPPSRVKGEGRAGA